MIMKLKIIGCRQRLCHSCDDRHNVLYIRHGVRPFDKFVVSLGLVDYAPEIQWHHPGKRPHLRERSTSVLKPYGHAVFARIRTTGENATFTIDPNCLAAAVWNRRTANLVAQPGECVERFIGHAALSG